MCHNTQTSIPKPMPNTYIIHLVIIDNIFCRLIMVAWMATAWKRNERKNTKTCGHFLIWTSSAIPLTRTTTIENEARKNWLRKCVLKSCAKSQLSETEKSERAREKERRKIRMRRINVNGRLRCRRQRRPSGNNNCWDLTRYLLRFSLSSQNITCNLVMFTANS